MARQRQKELRALLERQQSNNDRINEIADLCEKEKRTRTPQEDEEFARLTRDNDIVRMKIAGLQDPTPARVTAPGVELRDNLAAGKKTAFVLVRDDSVDPVTLNTTADLAGTGIIPIQQQQLLKPLRTGLIYDKVGLKIGFGLRGGVLRWPRHGKLQAKWRKEGERAEDQKIDWSKLETSPEGLSVAVAATREELEDSDGLVESVINEEMPAAITDAVNAALFTTEGTYTDKDNKTKNKVVVGPFVKAAENAFEFAGDVPTRKELLKMKAKVASCGLQMVAPCWVMTETMKAELEDQKVDAGSGRFVCENDHILGYPVFTTPEIGEGNIGFGDWAYQAAGFFDSMNILVDPYTLSRNNAVDFVLHARFATVTLYEEAFVLGHKKAAAKE